MSKVVAISAPVDTYSGYGARARDFVKSLIKLHPEWDIRVLSQPWGNTRLGFLRDEGDTELSSRLVDKVETVPDVWIQITVPNEFMRAGKFNIGVTAAMETTAVSESWVRGCNRMDLVITSTKHGADSLTQSLYKNIKTGEELKVTVPVEILFEGMDIEKYRPLETSTFDLTGIKENFAFLCVGHWMKGAIGEDRKNIGYTIKAFLETFKGVKNAPALILKTQRVGTSLIDRETILTNIRHIMSTVNSTQLPNIYLLSGEISDDEMVQLYNHPKVKAMVSLTKGEGFGRPLLEFALVRKPVMASGWSGQLDFLKPEGTYLISGTLTNVHPSAVVPDMILPESQWFTPDPVDVGETFKEIFKNYKKAQEKARILAHHCKTHFTLDKMGEKLQEIIEKYHIEEEKLPELKKPRKKTTLKIVE